MFADFNVAEFYTIDFQLLIDQLWAITRSINFADILDMAISAFLIYKLIVLVRQTRAIQLVKGVLVVLALYVVVLVFQLTMLETVLRLLLTYGALVLLVLFQPELRSVLAQMGQTSISKLALFQNPVEKKDVDTQPTRDMISEIVYSCEVFSRTHTGALMVIECETKIGDIISTGTLIDAVPSKELIQNIFFHNAPLHDGAVVIREGRLYSAGCFLPLSQNYEISNALGTRHRAALGMSEVSDAIVLVVSEETGAISVVRNGKLNRGLSSVALAKLLANLLLPPETPTKKKKGYTKIFRRGEE